MKFKCYQSKIWNTLKVRNIPHSSMFHKSVLEALDTNSPTLSLQVLHKWNIHCIPWQSLLGWGVSIWWNTFDGSGGMSWHWRNTGSTHGSLGCLCGNDRISWFPNFAVPISCCWSGHTCHWCNRQLIGWVLQYPAYAVGCLNVVSEGVIYTTYVVGNWLYIL